MIEILAPAGSPESLKAAVYTGADAVYLGLENFSARKSAKNFTADELYEAARFCRLSGIKLYLALNTLVFDEELEDIRKAVQAASNAGINAVIIQDLGVLNIIKETTPDMKIHASTQMTINSASGIKAAKKLGISRVVLARELSLDEIEKIAEFAQAEKMETEVFIHGALCVSVSGQCMMSANFGNGERSANRGSCAQPCRLDFTVGGVNQALSLKDLSVIKYIGKLEQIGVTSVKIEGRMKRPEYVAAAVDACFKAREGEKYDEELLRAVFSRSGFTDGWFSGEIKAMRGFREKKDVISAEGVLKNLQKLYKDPKKRRELNISLEIKRDSGILCEAECDGACVSLSEPPPQKAQNRASTAEEITTQLSKLGGTIFSAGRINCKTEPDLYLSAAQINAIRRRAAEEISEKLMAGEK